MGLPEVQHKGLGGGGWSMGGGGFGPVMGEVRRGGGGMGVATIISLNEFFYSFCFVPVEHSLKDRLICR